MNGREYFFQVVSFQSTRAQKINFGFQIDGAKCY